MTAISPTEDPNALDAGVDLEIASCLSLEQPKSFFLFAGAGSGKTRSLVEALQHIRKNHTRRLRVKGQKIAVITYTNKACDEIMHRIGYDTLFDVSTIHSFIWSLIQGFNDDIRNWLKIELKDQINELKEKEAKGRKGTQASLDRIRDIEKKTARLMGLDKIHTFNYSPTGENRGRDSLSHSEVVKISTAFLTEKDLLKRILINKYPVLLIDESQDTNKNLMEAFLSVQRQYSEKFSLGLFGDLMQRIYADGKEDLGQNLPANWATPIKKMNHRCPKRVITLVNKLRSEVDDKEQKPRTDAIDGVVRLFILNSAAGNKPELERQVALQMSQAANDEEWLSQLGVKTLILEHHMAANRMGFIDMYAPLYKNEQLKTGLLEGSLGGIKLFTDKVLPLVKARREENKFRVAEIVRKYSPLISKASLRHKGDKQIEAIQAANKAVENLWDIFESGAQPRMVDVLRNIAASKLFEIPDSLITISQRSSNEQKAAEEELYGKIANEEELEAIDSWDEALLATFEQVALYDDYINGRASFDTHQGVKGLEFPRVMVIVDDEEARGFMFSYAKLFGEKEKSPSDLKNEKEGNETSIDRTRRLFYVTCSRAEKSLAIVAYSNNPEVVKANLIGQGWFKEEETVLLSN